MTRYLWSVLIVVGVLGAASHASAACQRIATQLDCDLGASQIVIGTQSRERVFQALRPPPFHGSDPASDDHTAPAPSFGLGLQDIDSGTSLCRDTENERYCD